jgi:hypothetical protein
MDESGWELYRWLVIDHLDRTEWQCVSARDVSPIKIANNYVEYRNERTGEHLRADVLDAFPEFTKPTMWNVRTDRDEAEQRGPSFTLLRYNCWNESWFR